MALNPNDVRPVSPDPFIRTDADMMLIKLGHYKALLEFVQSSIPGAAVASDVTQQTSISTAVETDALHGKITTVSSTLAADTGATFQVDNPLVNANSEVLLTVVYQKNGFPVATISTVSAGSFTINLRNLGTAALNGAVGIFYSIVPNNS